MVKLLGRKVTGAVSYMDLFGAGVVKYAEERALAPYIGNGTLKSGLIKLGIGLGSKRILGSGVIKDSISLGFGIDGVEDVLTHFIGGIGGTGGGEDW